MNSIYRTLALVGVCAALVSCGGKKAQESAPVAQEEDRTILVSTATAVVEEVPQTEVYSSTVEAFSFASSHWAIITDTGVRSSWEALSENRVSARKAA